jgi:hypothetical protein
MSKKSNFEWPSGECKPVLATHKNPTELVSNLEIEIVTFRDQDDLDWFEGALVPVSDLGLVLIMRHDNNPLKLTALYVDSHCDSLAAEERLIKFFCLREKDIAWRLTNG